MSSSTSERRRFRPSPAVVILVPLALFFAVRIAVESFSEPGRIAGVQEMPTRQESPSPEERAPPLERITYRDRSVHPDQTVRIGSIVRFKAGGVVGSSYSGLARYNQYRAAGDTIGIEAAERNRQAVWTATDIAFRIISTRVNPAAGLGSDAVFYEVRILDGPLAGQTGWIDPPTDDWLVVLMPHGSE